MKRGIIYLIAIGGSFTLTLILLPLVVYYAKKIKRGQPILSYVEEHKGKQGTPTMGGIAFILSICGMGFVLSFNGLNQGIVASIATLCYAFIGFLDDFLKLKRKDNKGLSPLQKIVSELCIALLLGWYCYKLESSRSVIIPFSDVSIDLGVWIIPLSALVFISITNAVNLTDGLDGLASGVVNIYSICFFVINLTLFSLGKLSDDSLAIFSLCIFGGTLAFSIYNQKPARIFMGDTGSLALGGALGCISCFSGNYILIPLVGIIFVWSCISVIIQVVAFKLTKRRVFLMAPFHHHLQRKGYSEPQIGALYKGITILSSCIAIFSILYFCRGV